MACPLCPPPRPLCRAPPTEDKSSAGIKDTPRGRREFSLRLVSRNGEKSFYILPGIDLLPFPFLPSFFVRGNFHPLFRPISLFPPFSNFLVYFYLSTNRVVFGKIRTVALENERPGFSCQVTNGRGNLENEDRFAEV